METPHNPPASASPTRYRQPNALQQRPLVVVTGIWLVLLVLGWLSMSEILSPGANAPLPKTPIAQAKQQEGASLGLLGALAGGCAALSLLLAQKYDRR
jgi:hypothetical protein